jgi:hypothetical protein
LAANTPERATSRTDDNQKEDAVGLKMTLAGVALISAAALGGCNRQGAPSDSAHLTLTGSKYCTPFPSASTASNATGGLGSAVAASDPAAAFDDCIHRWGYALAPSRDPADVVAQASVEACSTILANWSQQIGQQGEPSGDSARGGRDAPQTPDPEAQRMHAAEGRALFYVVQARAGGCAAPPASTLVAPTVPSS